MKINRRVEDGVAVMVLEGEFDSFETNLVDKHFTACLEEGHQKIVLDCEKLTFVNSTTIAYFIQAQKSVRAQGGDVIFAQPRTFIRKTLDTLGLGQVFRMSDSVDAAIAELK